jgi:ribonuclease R
VRLVEAAPVAGALRFELLSEGRYNVAGRRPMRREHSTRAPSGNRARRARMGRQ